MLFISYSNGGRFGNNVFQYITTKVLQHLINKISGSELYKYEYMYHLNYTKYNDTTSKKHKDVDIDEVNFFEVYELLKMGINPFSNKNLYVNGFFQFDILMLEQREFIKSLFTVDNTERINDQYRVCDLMKSVNSYNSEFDSNDLIFHIRLDDFIHNVKDANIIHPNVYINLINKIKEEQEIKRVFVIVDKLRRPYEFSYIEELKKGIKNLVVMEGSEMMKDLSRMYHAKNLICSNSTFSWIPLIIGKSEKNWFPKLGDYYSNQKITKLHPDSILYDYKLVNFC